MGKRLLSLVEAIKKGLAVLGALLVCYGFASNLQDMILTGHWIWAIFFIAQALALIRTCFGEVESG